MSTRKPRPSSGLMTVHPEHPTSLSTGVGWTIFAAAMMFISAAVNGVWGLVAILSDDYWGGDQLVSGHAALWGWLWIGFATFQAAVAVGVLVRNAFAVFVGIGLTIVSVIAQAIAFDNYPIWTAAVLILDALVLWALIRHGFDD